MSPTIHKTPLPPERPSLGRQVAADPFTPQRRAELLAWRESARAWQEANPGRLVNLTRAAFARGQADASLRHPYPLLLGLAQEFERLHDPASEFAPPIFGGEYEATVRAKVAALRESFATTGEWSSYLSGVAAVMAKL